MTGLVLVGKLAFGSGVPGFVLVGAEHAEGFLDALGVVEPFDVAEDQDLRNQPW
jgi:hypothetical protein